MGFNAKVLILFKRADREAPEKTAWTWHRTDVIDFDRVTRVEKLTDKARYGHVKRSAHERFGICLVSAFLGRIFAQYESADGGQFAPPFLLYGNDEERTARATEPDGPTEFLDIGFLPDEIFPESFRRQVERMKAHNHALSLREAEFRFFLTGHNPIAKPPFLWESCLTLARWLLEAEDKRTDEWKELQADAVSEALARAWRAYLLALGTVDARALFVFD